MGLRQRLIDAKVNAMQEAAQGSIDVDSGPGSQIYLEADYTAKAILQTLNEADLTITQLKAPVVLETLQTPEQLVNIDLAPMLGQFQPVLKLLHKIGDPLGLTKTIDNLENEIEAVLTPLLEGGASMVGLEIGKDSGGLQSTGYVYIGDDPDSLDSFSVESEDGQRENTTVKLSIDDIERLV